ncbi:MAG: hypothetical protein P8X46_13805, partial [Nitrospirales bacterium]
KKVIRQGAGLLQSPFDGQYGKFADRDVSIRKYYRDEDATWPCKFVILKPFSSARSRLRETSG